MAYQRLIRGIHASSSSILPLIFIECIDYGEDDPGPLITKVNDGPWALSRVSHAWLTISLQTPQIWAKIRIGGPEDDFNDIMPFDPVSLLRLALVRSRKAPLSVKLEFSRDPGFDYNGAALMRNVPRRASMICRNLIRVMAAYSARWQKAQLALTGSFIPLLDPIRARLPLLRILSVHNNGDEDPKQEFTFISEAPLLREVTLLNMPFQNVTLPWSQITYFEDIRLDAPPIPLKDVPDKTAAYVNLLRANPQLEDLNVASGSFGTGFGKPIRPRVVHNLPKLRATSPRFLQALILPMLTEFSTVGPEPGTYAAILDLIKRSKCDINTLSLADFQPQTEIFEILRLTPHLKHLSLRFSGWQKMYDTAMEMLVKRLTAERDFLPHLEALDVYISPLPPTCYADSEREGIYRMKQPDTSDYPIKVQFMNDAFFKMVEGRWDKIGKGSMYSIFFLAELPTRLVRLSRASVAKIGRMCDRGLDVEINAEDPYGKGEMISYVYQSSCQSNTFCPLYHPRR